MQLHLIQYRCIQYCPRFPSIQKFWSTQAALRQNVDSAEQLCVKDLLQILTLLPPVWTLEAVLSIILADYFNHFYAMPHKQQFPFS